MRTTHDIHFSERKTPIGHELTGSITVSMRAIVDYECDGLQAINATRFHRERISRAIMFDLYGQVIHEMKELARMIKDPGDRESAEMRIRELESKAGF